MIDVGWNFEIETVDPIGLLRVKLHGSETSWFSER